MSGEYKKLYRSRKERMLAGVCGGLGEYFGIDPTLFRLLFIVAALFGGPGIIAYLLFLIIVPEEPVEQSITSVETTEDEIQEEEPS